jgi:hypothetical protein
VLNQAEVAGAISSYYGVSPGNAAVSKLLAVIFPDVQSAAARDVTSWRSVFPSVLAKYERMANELGLGVSPQQREIEAARSANPSAAGPQGFEGARFAGLHRSNLPLAMSDDGDTRRSNGDRATAATLARDVPLNVTGAIGYARELGMNPALAGFFVGASTEMRDALRGAIHNGTHITDDQVKNTGDVSAVIGAIRAGKLKADDPRIPPSVKSIIEDMKKSGVDTNDSNAVRSYLKKHPDALDAAKKKADERLRSKASETPAEATQSLEDKLKAKLAKKTDGGQAGKPMGSKPTAASPKV